MIPGLDGLRAIAFLSVLGIHAGNFPFGWSGVQLFFVLSGFLITNILVRMKMTFNPRTYFSKFYGRRFLRIFPLYYFFILLVIGLAIAAPLIGFKPLQNELGGKLRGQILSAIFYIYNLYVASSIFRSSFFLGPLWSLSSEEQFYILWPLILLITPKDRFKSLFLGAVALGPLLRLIISLAYRFHLFPFLGSNVQLAVYVLPFAQVDAFAIGAYASQFEFPRPRFQFALATLLIPAVGYLSQYLTIGQVLPSTLGYQYEPTGLYKEVWQYSLLNYWFAVTIYCVARTHLFTRVLDTAIPRYLGKISYGLYVYHSAVIWSISRTSPSFQIGSFNFFLVALVITTIVASLSYYCLEKPITDLKDKYFDIHSQKPETSSRVPV